MSTGRELGLAVDRRELHRALTGVQSADLSNLRIRQEGDVVCQMDGLVEDWWAAEAVHCPVAGQLA